MGVGVTAAGSWPNELYRLLFYERQWRKCIQHAHVHDKAVLNMNPIKCYSIVGEQYHRMMVCLEFIILNDLNGLPQKYRKSLCLKEVNLK